MATSRLSRLLWTTAAIALAGFFTVVLWPLVHEGFRRILFRDHAIGSRSEAPPPELSQAPETDVVASPKGTSRTESEPELRTAPSARQDPNGKAVREHPPKFLDVEIRSPFDEILQSDPLMMSTSGASVVRLADDSNAVFSVASTPITDQSPEERLRAEKVCRVKALASLLGQDQPVLVIHSDELRERTTAIVGPRGRRTSVSEVLSITRVQLEGYVRDMPIVGRWLSEDGRVFYLAIGAVRGNGSE